MAAARGERSVGVVALLCVRRGGDDDGLRVHPLHAGVCVCVCVCVCVFIKLHITAQSGPVIYSFYATACNPPGGYLP